MSFWNYVWIISGLISAISMWIFANYYESKREYYASSKRWYNLLFARCPSPAEILILLMFWLSGTVGLCFLAFIAFANGFMMLIQSDRFKKWFFSPICGDK